MPGRQTKLSFAATTSTTKKSTVSKSEGKGKAKQAVVDSDEDELDSNDDPAMQSSSTVGNDAMDYRMESDGSEEVTAAKKQASKKPSASANAKASTSKSSSTATRSAPVVDPIRPTATGKSMTATAMKKKEMMAIVISDDSDDSDDGRTFKGFSTNRATAAKKRK